MSHFRERPGSNSAIRTLKVPFPDIIAFDAVVRSITMGNPFGCTSYWLGKRTTPGRESLGRLYGKIRVRGTKGEMGRERVRSVQLRRRLRERHRSGEIEHGGHRSAQGKVRHIPKADLFSVTLKCHDHGGELSSSVFPATG